MTLRTYEFTVVNETGTLKPKDEAGLKRFFRWKELNLVVRGAGQDPKERFFATDVHFKQRSTLKVPPLPTLLRQTDSTTLVGVHIKRYED